MSRAETRLVPPEKPTTYYGRPIVKPPVWKPEIPFYFFFGGLAGASSVLAAAATFAGRRGLARRAWAGAFVGVTASPVLLIKDLGKPSRFLNMLRVVKVTSPMSLGAWLLAANGASTSYAAALNLLAPRRRGGAHEIAAAALGAPLATYTASLITNSAIPAWSEARWEMPFVFASSATASAAGAALLTVPDDEAEPARALAISAVVFEEAATAVMHKRLGPLADAYKQGAAGRFGHASRALSAAGAAALAAGRGRRDLSAAGGALLLAGAVCKRWSVFKAGFNSAEDPTQTVRIQRDRIARDGSGA
ncbi:MAG TPA: NrfD/PsrC family molybdoenzyme membrane anchor subunit [Solirubrobacterales bacterium]|jgi:formate-dependent nitrite reductase membrane component NrfD|nr:NrfD/PsrC family molybdoenzyme membrane anchor subunit [Solirubrobacterales bacterium]